MKKTIALLLALVLALGCLTSCGGNGQSDNQAADVRVAMITDYGDITDQSFNQTTYEACKAFSEANGLDFSYFKPVSDSDEDRVSMIESAIDQGYNVVVMPGYAFGKAIETTASEYPDITFIAPVFRRLSGRAVRLYGRRCRCQAGLHQAGLPGRHGCSRRSALWLRLRAGR